MLKSLLLIVFMLFSSVSLATEQYYGLNKYYWVDNSSSLSVEQIQQQEFTAYEKELNLGFQDGAVWLRLEIEPPTGVAPGDQEVSAKTSPMILRMGPYVLDTAVMYEPSASGWQMQSLGDRVGSKQSLCHDGAHCFALQSSPSKPVTLYVKVMQRGVFSVRADVVAWADLPAVVARGSGRNAAALAVSISLFLLGVALFLVEPSIILLVFCVFEALVVLVVAATTGILSQYFESVSPATMDTLTHHLFNLRVMLFVLIGWAVMSSYHPSLKYKRMVLFLMLLCLAAAVLINAGLIHWAIALYLTVTGLNLVLQIYALVVTGGISKKIRILLGVGYAMFTLVFWNALVNLFPDILPVKPLSSVNSFGDWRINGGPAGLIFFLFVIIYNAERKLADSKALGLFKLQAAQSEANAEKLSERQTLIDMLTHELKNPLGTMRFALASLKMQTFRDEDTLLRVKRMDMSVQRMNDLIEQVAGSNKIDRFELTDELELIDAAELIQMLISDELTDDRFKLRIAPGVQFHSHRRMLAMIIENLIGNAFKYAEPLKDILINVFVQDQATVFQIANSVNPSQLPDPSQLFKRYYRHDSVQALPGLGIGLSLVKTASEKIGAKVGFVIERNTITFTLKVPL